MNFPALCRTLDLSCNGMVTIGDELGQIGTSLKALDLQSNEITEVTSVGMRSFNMLESDVRFDAPDSRRYDVASQA